MLLVCCNPSVKPRGARLISGMVFIKQGANLFEGWTSAPDYVVLPAALDDGQPCGMLSAAT